MQILWQQLVRFRRLETRLLLSILIIAGLLLAFVLIAGEVMEGEPLAFDRQILLAFRDAGNPAHPIGPAWVQEMARDVTSLGSFAVLAIVVGAGAGYLFLAHKRAAAWLLLGTVLGGSALNTLLKFGFARPRPELVAPVARVFTASFPSGHAALAAVTYLTLGALLTRVHPSRPIRIYFITVAVVLALLIGVSRVYLGVHYPTDVLAGWCIGAAWALACWIFMTRLQQQGQD
jgi:undecaprenyl-diphosphatase